MLTLHESIQDFKAAVALDRLISRRTLTAIRFVSFGGMVLAGGAWLVLSHTPLQSLISLTYIDKLLGIALLSSTVWLDSLLAYAYHNSFYYRGMNSVLGLEEESVAGATYDVAEAVLQNEDDVTFAFCTSLLGSQVLLRAGVPQDKLDDFLRGDRQRITSSMVGLPEEEIFSLIGLGKYLLQHDVGFRNMLERSGVLPEMYHGALRWVIGTQHQLKRTERWWSKDNLSKTRGLGREWSYGTAYMLERYARDIRTTAVFSTLNINTPYAEEKVSEIETNLARTRSSNVLIIGEPGVGKMDLVMEVARRMQRGTALASIAGQNIVVLDTTRILATNTEKSELEQALLKLFIEAEKAGNLIIAIENISKLIREAEALGVFLPELIDPFLASQQLKFIMTDSPGSYHTYLEPLGAFVRRFAEILIDTPDLSATTRVLQGVAAENELRHKVIFTYGGLSAITTAAERYVVEGVMPDKAISLLVDVAGRAQQAGRIMITEDFVYEVVSDKTGVPAGPIGEDEKELLLHLEDKLHQQVVGQQRALDAIAKAMRRGRAGIQAADKPIGSFLFLGPTGVGKTETAKALAKIFFGGEDKLERLDMSEFSGEDALGRLLGDSEHSGTLSDMMREHPYCVLLLDEFEKASQDVHDLFLQILDEGVFTDARGERVNARNTIIIATSNAGAQLILRTVQQRKELAHLTQEIINHIVSEGIYRPELLNRFDSTIIFEPLTIEEQNNVAGLMLEGLYSRIRERGYSLEVSPDLLTVLVEKGYSPEFGARPMQRVLQDMVEEKVAQKIIAGDIHKGDKIVLSKADFTSAELATGA
ncbi:ATP-dependent Clp protease ATP-binding subunit [Candidatus Kaiserbacteria bacterium]|nr:ATP-dependent Clp protease ATP-binding subunit [Candidatus Kaiserbacteria bacterium]